MNIDALQQQFKSSSKKQTDQLASAKASASAKAKARSDARKSSKGAPPSKQTKKQLLKKVKEHNTRVCHGAIRNAHKMRKASLAKKLGVSLA